MLSVKLPKQSAILTVMTRAVIKASKGLLRDFNELENLQVSRKNNKDFVTSADLKSDSILREELLGARPDYALLSEESSKYDNEDHEYRWIIDPLDGTINYMHGFAHWAISIALERHGEVVAGVTFDPLRNEMFWAEKGLGAFVNDKRLRVSGKRSLADLLIGVSSLDEEIIKKLSRLGLTVRKTGSTTLNMAYLAAGRLDLLFASGFQNKWDVAAGMLFIKEAGGVIADEKGRVTDKYTDISVMTNVNILSLLF